MVNRILVILFLLIFSSGVFAKELVARVDRFEIGINESIELAVIMVDARGQRPDLSELLKDFTVDRHTQSSNFTLRNGAMSQQIQWTFLLSPTRKGTLVIPALKSAGLSTDPIEIKVGDQQVAKSTSDDALIEVEVKPLHPYVQGQVVYIQRLYYSRPLVDNASISSPKISMGEAEVEFLGSTNPRYVKHNGRSYQLIERFYAVFPKQAGPLHFEPSVFRGSLASSRQNRSSISMFNHGTRVNAFSPKAELTISDKPASFTGEHWLPASKVTLNMNWSRSSDTLKVGEPVTVTIALLAEGAKAEVLPEVALSLPDVLKVYPEQPTFRSDKGGNGLTGLREEKFTLVGNENGEYQIPAVEIPWWNTNTDQQEFARLDSFTIKVGGAATGASLQNNNQAATQEPFEEKLESETKPEAQNASALVDLTVNQAELSFYDKNKVLILVALAVMAGLFLIGGGLFWRKREGRSSLSGQSLGQQRQKAVEDLSRACKENNPRAAIAGLPAWARSVGIHPATLAGIERCNDSALIDAVRALSQASYSQKTEAWNGEELLRTISHFSEASLNSPEPSGLSPLHPIT